MKKFAHKSLMLAVLLGTSLAAYSGTVRVPYSTAAYSASAMSGTTVAFDLGSFAVGMVGLKTFTYTNNTSKVVSVDSIDFSSNVYLQSGGCSTLSPGESCEVTLALLITAEGANSGTATFNAIKEGSTVKDTFELNAAGVATASVFTVSPNKGSFSYYGETQTFNILNSQSFPITIDSVQPSSSAWVVTGTTCAGTTLNAGQTCGVTAKYNTSRTGNFTGNLKILVASVPFSTIPVTGSIVYGTPSFDVDYLSFPGSRVNTPRVKTILVKNTGLGKLVVNNVQVTGDTSVWSIPTTTCNSVTLQPQETCAVDIKALFTSANKSAQGALSFSFANTGQSSVYLSMQGDSVVSSKLLTVSPLTLNLGDNPLGATVQGSFTVTSSGADTVSISNVSFSGGDAGKFTVNKADCIKDLAPGATCQLPVTLTTDQEGTKTTTLTITSNADTATTANVTANVQSPVLSLSPTAIAFQGKNLNGYSQVVTVSNIGAYSSTIKSVVPSSGYVSISNDNCTNSNLTAGQQCTFQVNVPTPVVGTTNASVAVNYSAGAGTKSISATVSSAITSGGLNLSAFTCPPGKTSQTTAPCTATLSNPTVSNVSVTSLTRANTAVFMVPTIEGNVLPTTLAPGASKSIQISLASPYTTATTSKEGSYQTDVTVKSSAGDVTGQAAVIVLRDDPATGSMSAFTCTNPGLGVLVTCTSTVTNNSRTLALPIASVKANNSAFSLQHNCGTSLAAAKSCAVTLTVTPSNANSLTTDVTVVTNPVLTQTATVAPPVASFEVTTPAAVNILAGKTITQTTLFKNVSGVPVNLSLLTKTVSGTRFTLTSTTCNGVLANNATCNIVSTFSSPAAVLEAKGAANLTGAIGSFSAVLTGSAYVDGISVARLPGNTYFAGYASGSGNKYSITNLGLTAQVIKTIAPPANMAIGIDAADSTPCRVGTTSLAKGASCTFVEVASLAAMPTVGTIIGGTGSVTTNTTVKGSWSSAYQVVPPKVVVVDAIPAMSAGDTFNTNLRITNTSMSNLTGITVAKTNTNNLVTATLDGSCPNLTPGQSCDIPLAIKSTGKNAATFTFTVSGAFAKERNGQFVSDGNNAQQAKTTASINFAIPAATWTTGRYALTHKGESNVATHTFKNTGTTVLNIASVAIKQGTGTGQSIAVDNCSNQKLLPNASCTITTSFHIEDNTITYVPATIDATMTSSTVFSAVVDPNAAGEPVVVIDKTECVGGTSYPSSLTVNFNMNSKSIIGCWAYVKNNGGGPFTLTGAYSRVKSAGNVSPMLEPQAGFTDVSFTKTTAGDINVDGQIVQTLTAAQMLGPVPTLFSRAPYVPTSDSSDNGSKYYPNNRFYATSPIKTRLAGGTDIHMDGSVTVQGSYASTAPSYVKLAPGGEAKIFLALIPCTTNSIGNTNVSWCYRGSEGGRELEVLLWGADDFSLAQSLRGFYPFAKFRIVANIKKPSVTLTTSAAKGVIRLNAGESVTFTYQNNDVEDLPFESINYLGAHNMLYVPRPAGALDNYVKNDNYALPRGGRTADVASRTPNTKYWTNPISGQFEVTYPYTTNGFITSTSCIDRTSGVPVGTNLFYLKPGQSCYVRQSCMSDPISGSSLVGRVALNEASMYGFSTEAPYSYLTYLYEYDRVRYLNERNGVQGSLVVGGSESAIYARGDYKLTCNVPYR